MRLSFLPLGLLLTLTLAAPAYTDGDTAVVRLRTGEAVKGRPIPEQSTLTILVMEDYLSGRVRQLSWDVVDPSDRHLLWQKWGRENRARGTVNGWRITIKLAQGATDEILGIIEREDAEAYYVRSGGQELKILKSTVLEKVEEPMDPRDVWTPDQLYQRLLQEWRDRKKEKGEDPDHPTVEDDWLLAEDAEWAGALDKARDHYKRCAEAPDFIQRSLAADRLIAVEALLRDKAALDTLKDVKMRLANNMFRSARALLDGFGAKHPDAGESVLKALEKTKIALTSKRASYFQNAARNDLPKIAERLIEEKLKEKDLTLSDATAWTRRELPEKLFDALAEKMKSKDDVLPDEARKFWMDRKKISWIRKTYGGGTFIQFPPKIKPPTQRQNPGGGGNKGGNQNGPAPVFQAPKPPTKDQWWAASHTSERVQWLMAFFAQNSGDLFEVDDDVDRRPCLLCHGEGLLHKTFQTGTTVSYLCTRCGGAQYDVTVKFR